MVAWRVGQGLQTAVGHRPRPQLLIGPAGCCVDAAAEHDLLGTDGARQQAERQGRAEEPRESGQGHALTESIIPTDARFDRHFDVPYAMRWSWMQRGTSRARPGGRSAHEATARPG